jgi:hypothetical protein
LRSGIAFAREGASFLNLATNKIKTPMSAKEIVVASSEKRFSHVARFVVKLAIKVTRRTEKHPAGGDFAGVAETIFTAAVANGAAHDPIFVELIFANEMLDDGAVHVPSLVAETVKATR